MLKGPIYRANWLPGPQEPFKREIGRDFYQLKSDTALRSMVFDDFPCTPKKSSFKLLIQKKNLNCSPNFRLMARNA